MTHVCWKLLKKKREKSINNICFNQQQKIEAFINKKKQHKTITTKVS